MSPTMPSPHGNEKAMLILKAKSKGKKEISSVEKCFYSDMTEQTANFFLFHYHSIKPIYKDRSSETQMQKTNSHPSYCSN